VNGENIKKPMHNGVLVQIQGFYGENIKKVVHIGGFGTDSGVLWREHQKVRANSKS